MHACITRYTSVVFLVEWGLHKRKAVCYYYGHCSNCLLDENYVRCLFCAGLFFSWLWAWEDHRMSLAVESAGSVLCLISTGKTIR